MGFGKIGSIPSKYDYSHERGPSLDQQLSGNGYSHKGNRMAQHSARAVVDLGIRCSSTTDFPNEPQGNNLPPGHPKCSCDNRLLQETELKPITLFIILPYFGTPNRTNVVRKEAQRMLVNRPGSKCVFPRRQCGCPSVVSLCRSAQPVLPPASIFTSIFTSHWSAALSCSRLCAITAGTSREGCTVLSSPLSL